ncbi:peptidoglycan DD-metalloendopeptidase family protein [Neomicrococcus lactis]|uniref:Murein DD-endopeptidase MepM/ murein hydrolase activator NlpD n=1 Tax=Neomicrococcus lactis TaxID=732241 RepID=A0A7W8Y9N4_9MICC|nr:murein DD-endopeptidase MepM/ murein hydrolase activator NlpD [Neomicrococcus lactis]
MTSPSRALKLSKAVIAGSFAALLTMGLVTPGASADELDDRKKQIEQNISTLENDLEYLDGNIQATAKKLKGLQDQLPGAQAELQAAEGRVSQATSEVDSLQQRVSAAESSRDDLAAEMKKDESVSAESKKLIGEIATRAYQRGGVSGNLGFLVSGTRSESLGSGIELADHAMRSQNAIVEQLSQKRAANQNAAKRLEAVEAEIKDLKSQADAALVREQSARDAALKSKQKVDSLISDAEKLSAQLAAERPQVQNRLKTQQAEHDAVLKDIAARQERLRKEAEERRKKALEAKRKAEAEAKRKAEIAAQKEREAQAALRARAADAARKAQAAAAAQREAEAAAAKETQAARAQPTSTSSWGLRVPTSGGYITSRFGWRPTPEGTIDYGGAGGYLHAGVDWGFGGTCGAPVYASAAGEVWVAGWGGSSGNKVTLSHGVMNGSALATNYHHLSAVNVSAGQTVQRGDIIGYVGTTGNSTGCHLHFETVVNGQLVDPLSVL